MGVVYAAGPCRTYLVRALRHQVIDLSMNRHGRRRRRNRPASGMEIIQELGEDFQRNGKVEIVDTSADWSSRSPRTRTWSRWRSSTMFAGYRTLIPTEQRGRARDRRPVHRRARLLRAGSRRLHAFPTSGLRAKDNLVHGREAGQKADGRRTKSARSPRTRTLTSKFLMRSNVEGIQTGRRKPPRFIDGGLDSGGGNLVHSIALGPPQRPGELPRCLQDFDRRLPDLLTRCPRTSLLIPDLGPRLRPDDAVDRPFAGARAAAALRRGA